MFILSLRSKKGLKNLMSKKKRIPINSLGTKLKEARLKLDITEEQLSWKINDKNIDERQIKKWERGAEFPNLDEIYKLSYFLEVNPNELLKIRNQIQDESQTEPNWHARNVFARFFKIGKPGMKFIFELVLGGCVLFLTHSFVDFTDKMGGEQAEEFTNQLVYDEIQEFAYQNGIGTEASKMKENRKKVNETNTNFKYHMQSVRHIMVLTKN